MKSLFPPLIYLSCLWSHQNFVFAAQHHENHNQILVSREFLVRVGLGEEVIDRNSVIPEIPPETLSCCSKRWSSISRVGEVTLLLILTLTFHPNWGCRWLWYYCCGTAATELRKRVTVIVFDRSFFVECCCRTLCLLASFLESLTSFTGWSPNKDNFYLKWLLLSWMIKCLRLSLCLFCCPCLSVSTSRKTFYCE